ncbi:7748_t:CDS:2 [Ambispora leptoticha]|uniref:Small RNA 2'-O-methyltransferase n=1 Tax=Ambispora leptoticha TaxID=144679 RepID=A0A9N9CYN6_9GLOM|nr:7748_t:CDS:2 [Ambispora leptoticha]
MSDKDSEDTTFFIPPLWRQRRCLANEILKKHKITSVLDFGCGEGALLSFLVPPSEEKPITRLAGLDLNLEILQHTLKICRPWQQDFEYLRLSPLTIDIYQGSVDVADRRLCGYEAIVCLEVVEHLDPPILDKFFEIVLGTYKPKILIVSTPNVEFNRYFPQLKYGTPEAILRNDDHRFEWTRQEFQDWSKAGASKYNYSVEFDGVGRLKISDSEIGHATQFAIFKDLQVDAKPMHSSFGEYQLVEHIVFPHYDEPEKTHEEIIEEIDYYMQFLCNNFEYNSSASVALRNRLNVSPSVTVDKYISFNELWDIHRIRQVCKSREKLYETLNACPHFTMINSEWIQVHKEYKLDEVEAQDEINHNDLKGSYFFNDEDECRYSESSNQSDEYQCDSNNSSISSTTQILEENANWDTYRSHTWNTNDENLSHTQPWDIDEDNKFPSQTSWDIISSNMQISDDKNDDNLSSSIIQSSTKIISNNTATVESSSLQISTKIIENEDIFKNLSCLKTNQWLVTLDN